MTLLCAPVIGPAFADALKQLRAIEREADVVELRLDKMAKLDVAEIRKLISQAKKPIIATFRAAREGGEGKAGDAVRCSFLKHCINAGAKLVDIELSSGKTVNELVKYAHEHGAKVIVSYHNFKKTPSLRELTSFAAKARKAGADIVKAATKTTNLRDNEIVFALMKYCSAKKLPFIAIGMNPTNAETRFKAINEGAFLTFGRIGQGSAPGQPTIAELRQYKLGLARARKPVLTPPVKRGRSVSKSAFRRSSARKK